MPTNPKKIKVKKSKPKAALKAKPKAAPKVQKAKSKAVPNANAKLDSLLKFVEDKINGYAQRILDQPDRADRSAMGELNFYVAFRNVLKASRDPRDRPSYRDLGLIDGINDTLKHLRILGRKNKFYE